MRERVQAVVLSKPSSVMQLAIEGKSSAQEVLSSDHGLAKRLELMCAMRKS
jgi:hypothetical protein